MSGTGYAFFSWYCERYAEVRLFSYMYNWYVITDMPEINNETNISGFNICEISECLQG
jgi:hypothetical protein